jgi:hypothetical protein
MIKVPLLKFSMRQILLLMLLISALQVQAQDLADSNLPIVIITTDTNPDTHQPFEISDDPRVLASMKIIKRPDGSRNYLADQNTAAYLNYNGRINIEIRGSTSQDLPKKPYGLTTLQADNVTNNNASLLGMPSENDWILNALAYDPSLIRDYVSYNLSRQMGNYAPRTVYCEVVVNGDYKGLYLLQEKIKADSNRVNILKITTADSTLPNISGGYITKADKTTGNDPIAWTMSSYAGTANFIHDLPKPEEVTAQQDSYIHTQFSLLGSTAHSNNINLINGYPALIDVPSFIDFMIMNELASNVDGYQLSTYFHKDRNGKLRAGPIWDFNLCYGNDLFLYGLDRSKTDIWQFSNGDNEGAKFWTDLFNNPTYKCYFSKRWNQVTQSEQPLNYNSMVGLIDNTVSTITEAMIREDERWGTIPDHEGEINSLKAFLSQRITWITNHAGTFSACNSVTIPQLVIDRINYNPGTSPGFLVSNDLEFIEIKNTQSTAVDLTGIYFRELGITYKFPNNAVLAANQSIFLASNPSVFQSKYGVVAFGQFTRNLSNSSQKLVLADAFGNTIDSVEYLDDAPWPDADGNGNFLQLVSTSLDNSLASSWIAANAEALSAANFSAESNFSIFPNPVTNVLTIHADNEMTGIKIFDVLGNLIFTSSERSATIRADFSPFAKGIYFLTIFDGADSITRKIIRQ